MITREYAIQCMELLQKKIVEQNRELNLWRERAMKAEERLNNISRILADPIESTYDVLQRVCAVVDAPQKKTRVETTLAEAELDDLRRGDR